MLERRVPSREDEPKDEEQSDDGLGLGDALDLRCIVVVEDRLAVRAVDEVGGDEGADDGKDENDEAGRDEQLRAAAPFVCVDGTEDGAREADYVLHPVQKQSRVVVGDACALQQGWVVVRYWAVARPLSKKPHGEYEHSAVALFARVEKLSIVPPAFVGAGY